MKNKQLLSSALLLTAAIIWGFAFVAQESLADTVPPFTVNALRSLIASVALIPVAAVTRRINVKKLTDLMDTLDTDEVKTMLELLTNLFTKAARYADIRGTWLLKTRQEKMDEDSYRTSAHDSFITAVRMLSRFEGKASSEWAGILDMDDRKRIGDFACFLTAFRGIEAR